MLVLFIINQLTTFYLYLGFDVPSGELKFIKSPLSCNITTITKGNDSCEG